mgnify:CR=1 FL=1
MNIEMKQAETGYNEPYGAKENLKPFLTCIDHTVSRETFSLLLDTEKDLLVTFPRPDEADLPTYYESEEYISHTDSKRTLMDKVYQMVKIYSLKKKLKLINKLSGSKGHILDIGCGTGDLLAVCEKDGWRISGTEPSDKARELAINKITYKKDVKKDLNEFTDSSHGKFDVITMWHVLEHVPNLMEYIKSLKELLSPNGYLLVAVPNFKSHDASHYKEFWAAYDVPRHLWHFSEKSIRNIFGKYDFKVIETLPMIFDSFYVSLLSEKNMTGKSNLISAFKTGLISNIKAKQTNEYSSKIYIIKKR